MEPRPTDNQNDASGDDFDAFPAPPMSREEFIEALEEVVQAQKEAMFRSEKTSMNFTIHCTIHCSISQNKK